MSEEKSKFVKEGGSVLSNYYKDWIEKNIPDPVDRLAIILSVDTIMQPALCDMVTVMKLFKGNAKEGIPLIQKTFQSVADMLKDVDFMALLEKKKEKNENP